MLALMLKVLSQRAATLVVIWEKLSDITLGATLVRRVLQRLDHLPFLLLEMPFLKHLTLKERLRELTLSLGTLHWNR